MFDNIIKEYEKCDCNQTNCDQCEKNCFWLGKKFVLNQASKNSIKMISDYMMISGCPNVLIFASCYSQKSEINDLMKASGLYSALLVAAERGEISCGNVFKLDSEQQAFLKKIVENSLLNTIVLM